MKRPLHDRVLVQREESEEKTAGGIIIPDTAKEKPMQGKVVSVGTGARDEQGKVTPLDVSEGDIILFGKWPFAEQDDVAFAYIERCYLALLITCACAYRNNFALHWLFLCSVRNDNPTCGFFF